MKRDNKAIIKQNIIQVQILIPYLNQFLCLKSKILFSCKLHCPQAPKPNLNLLSPNLYYRRFAIRVFNSFPQLPSPIVTFICTKKDTNRAYQASSLMNVGCYGYGQELIECF